VGSLRNFVRFLVAVRPGLVSPTLAARMCSTFDRLSRGRLLINVVTGGDPVELAGDGVFLDHDGRYEVTDEFLTIWRGLLSGYPKDLNFEGSHLRVRGASTLIPAVQQPYPPLYFGGSSPAGVEVGAKHADGVRQDSHGQRRMLALQSSHAAELLSREALEVSPNLWAGVGLVRGGAGTALVGSAETVAARMREYQTLGVENFIFSGYPHLEEAYRVAELLFPRLPLNHSDKPRTESRPLRGEIVANDAVPATLTFASSTNLRA